jgi:hypothetical protein
MTLTAKQLRQRREMGAQDFRNTQRRKASKTFCTPREKPPSTTGHANVGTDDDVRAYCLRMGYMIEVVK